MIGDAGLVTPEGDAEALSTALERLMTDRSLRDALGERGRVRALERFTQASVAERTVEVYRQVMEA